MGHFLNVGITFCRSLIHSTCGLGLSANFNTFLDELLVFRVQNSVLVFHWIMLVFTDWFGFG